MNLNREIKKVYIRSVFLKVILFTGVLSLIFISFFIERYKNNLKEELAQKQSSIELIDKLDLESSVSIDVDMIKRCNYLINKSYVDKLIVENEKILFVLKNPENRDINSFISELKDLGYKPNLIGGEGNKSWEKIIIEVKSI